MSDSVLKCENLTACYDSQPVLHDVNIVIDQPQFLLIVGPNGSGKTTLLRALRGLHREFAIDIKGRICIDNTDIVSNPPELLSEKIGIVFQRPSLQLLNLTVAEEIQIGLVFRGLPWETIQRRTNDLLYRLELVEIQNTRAFELSGGQQARTVVAGILSLKPSVILLDEPGSYFDPRSKLELLKDLKHLTSQGTTVLITSHRIEDELRFADHVIVLNRGRVETQGSPQDVVFGEVMNQVSPPRGFLEVSHALWEKGILRQKVLDPAQLGIHVPLPPPMPVLEECPKIVELRSVSVRYPNSMIALDSVSTTLKYKCINVVIGPNGSGKTTLAKACMGLAKLSKGRITIEGKDLTRVDRGLIAMIVGYSPSDPADMLFQRTVRDELLFNAESTLEFQRTLREIVGQFCLGDLLDNYPESLSMGQQKRLSIAIALLKNPRLLILDEPTLGLDSESVSTLIDLLLNLRRKASVVVMTHDLDVFLPLCDNMLALKAGRVVAEGDPRVLFTEELSENLNLKTPDLWEAWKAHPNLRTWREMTAEVLKGYEEKMES